MGGVSEAINSEKSTNNINLINSLILGFSFYILLTFLFFPNPLLNIVFESLAISLF
jgi:hypothetical protein